MSSFHEKVMFMSPVPMSSFSLTMAVVLSPERSKVVLPRTISCPLAAFPVAVML